MPSIDERIVSMAFQNSKFETGVATTMASLAKLDAALAKVGSQHSLGDIEKAASKVTLEAPMKAADALKTKMVFEQEASRAFSSIENAANRVHLTGPQHAMEAVKKSLLSLVPGPVFTGIEKASNVVRFLNPMTAVDRLRSKMGELVAGKVFGDLERAGDKVTLEGPNRALDKVQGKIDQIDPKGLQNIERAGDGVTLDAPNRAVDGLISKFSILEGAASVALGNIASQAMMRGGQMLKSLTLGPVIQGFEEYGTNMKSIQTILANTEQSGATLGDVNKALAELNHYSDQTIYNFSEMAKNIGTFTAAGVDLERATGSIKGIANMAALGGSNSEQASRAMYQLSQAISSGRVSLQDWNSVVNAGMGGVRFQGALVRTAQMMGTIDKNAVQIKDKMGNLSIAGQSFRESIQARPGQTSWLTSDVLVKTLNQMTGDMTDAQLAAEGFSAAEIKAIQSMAQTAKKAATEVKTLDGVLDVVKESLGSGFAKSFQLIFGDFKEAKTLFTGLTNYITGWTGKMGDARNKVLNIWKKGGGRLALIEGIKEAWEGVSSVLKSIGGAYRDVFPATTGKELIRMTKAFRDFMEELKPGQQTLDNIRRIFRGIFSVAGIGWKILKDLVSVFTDIAGAVGTGSGGFLEWIASIADVATAANQAITEGEALVGIFEALEVAIRTPIETIRTLGSILADLFQGDSASGQKAMGDMWANLKAELGPALPVLEAAAEVLKTLFDIGAALAKLLGPLAEAAGVHFQELGDKLAAGIAKADWGMIANALEASFLGGIFVMLQRLLNGGGLKLIENLIGGDLIENLGDSLKALTGHLTAMQANVKANTLLQIGLAILAMAAGITILSNLPAEKIASSMTAIAVGLGQLIGAMRLLTHGTLDMKSAFMLPVVASGIVLMAGAVTMLAVAVFMFSRMSWEDLGKGMAGISGGLTALAMGTRMVSPTMLFATAAGLVPMAIALNILVVAMKAMATMSWPEMVKGLVGVAGALAGIGMAMRAFPLDVTVTAAGLLLVAGAVTLLAGAIRSFGMMDPKQLFMGLWGAATAVAGLGSAMALIPNPKMLAAGAGSMIILGFALTSLAAGLAVFGNLPVGKTFKAFGLIAASLAILAPAIILMAGAAPGAAGLLAAAVALAVLTPVLYALGAIDILNAAKGIGIMAAALTTIGIVSLIAAPGLTALGMALIPIGIGFTLNALAVLTFAKAISMVAGQSKASMVSLIIAMQMWVTMLPKLIVDTLRGIIKSFDEAFKLLPTIVEALVKTFTMLLEGIVKLAPRLGLAAGALILAIADAIIIGSPGVARAIEAVLAELMGVVSRNMEKWISMGLKMIQGLLDGLARGAPKMVKAGADLVINWLKSMDREIPRVSAQAVRSMVVWANALEKQMPRIMREGIRMMITLADALDSGMSALIGLGTRSMVRFITGMGRASEALVRAAAKAAGRLMHTMSDELVGLADVGFEALIKLLNGLERSIRENGPRLRKAGWGVADALIDGMVDGFNELSSKITNKAKAIAEKLPGPFKKVLGIKSPSRVFAALGRYTMQGLINGMGGEEGNLIRSAEGVSHTVIDAFKDTFQIRSPSRVMKEIGKEVGRGFRDGLDGSADDIRNSFQSLREKLESEMQTARDNIKSERQRLADLRKEEKPDLKAIKESERALAASEKILMATSRTRTLLTKQLQGEKNTLIRYSKDIEKVTEQLDLAKQELDRLTSARTSDVNKYVDQYSGARPDVGSLIDEAMRQMEEAEKPWTERWEAEKKARDDAEKRRRIDQVALYKKALADQIAATQKYNATLTKLRELGMDDTTYREMLDKGTAGQEFADALLRSGKDGIAQINTLNANLLAEATKVAQKMAIEMHNNGIQIAEGLVKGLEARKGALESMMANLADTMVRAIKAKLKIKSPSQVFEGIGKFSAEGVAKGLQSSSSLVASAAAGVGDDAALALTNSLANIRDKVGAEIDTDLTITPVLDLSQVARDAQGLKDLTNVTPITAAASFGQASAISAEKLSADQATEGLVPEVKQFHFEQNIHAPEALSEVEIYRHTKNHLSQVKQGLGLTA